MVFHINRYRDKILREFTVEVVTPMFLGGAEINEAELRTASLKGMLRFWWRATCGICDIKEMQAKEGALFGDTSCKAPFAVWIQNIDGAKGVLRELPKGLSFKVESSRGKFNLGIIDYLAYGLRDQKKYLREHYPAGTKFKVNFLFANRAQETEIANTFLHLIRFGGLGARNRNGFGCLDAQEQDNSVKLTGGNMNSYSSISSSTECFITKKKDFRRWEEALSVIGLAYRDARLSLERKRNYEMRSLVPKPMQEKQSQKERHAKPYYLHVGKTNAGYYGQILYMPYRYMAGSAAFSDERFRKYLEVGKKMNRIIQEQLSGGGA